MIVTKSQGRKKIMQSDKNTTKLYRQINERSNLLCLKSGYVMSPSPAQIVQRNFIIKDLMIRNQNTEAVWRGTVDLRNLKAPLYSLVDLGPIHIEVYPNDSLKPMAGKELNKKCFVTFSRLARINQNKLKKICEQNQCQVLTMDLINKSFTVQIKHFSKYAFDEALDEEKQEQKQIQTMQAQPTKPDDEQIMRPAQQLKKIQTRKYLTQTQLLRSMNAAKLKRTQIYVPPTKDLQNDVRKHNQQNKHSIKDERIMGSTYTIGVNGAVSSMTLSNDTHVMMFNAVQEINRDNLNIVLNILKENSQINNYILSDKVPFQVKKVLVLSIILNSFQDCRFAFQKNQSGKIILVSIKEAPEMYYKSSYIKNWFQWVVNTDGQAWIFPQNQLLRALCLRKGPTMAEKYMKFKKSQDAQFLCSIEDQSYRSGDLPKALSPELWNISLGNMTNFQNLDWVIQMSVCLWYFSFDNNFDSRVLKILKDGPATQNRYNLQRHMFYTSFSLPYQNNLFCPNNRNQLPLWWLISHKNHQRQVQINNNSFRYSDYRYSLLSEMVQDYADTHVTLQLVSHDKLLKKQQRLKILRAFICQFPQQAERVPITIWAQYSDLVNQNSACLAYSNNQYFKALQYFGKCKHLQKTSINIIQQIAMKQQILCSFYKKTSQKSKNLLQNIKKNTNIQCQLDDYISFLSILTGKLQLTIDVTKKLVALSYKIIKFCVRERMLKIIFECMIKSPNTLYQLKSNAQFFDYIYEIYVGHSYRLQLKIIKLSQK